MADLVEKARAELLQVVAHDGRKVLQRVLPVDVWRLSFALFRWTIEAARSTGQWRSKRASTESISVSILSIL